MDNEFIQIITTIPSKEIEKKIAKDLLNNKLAACTQLLKSPIKSRYWWKGKIEKAKEWILIIKTKKILFSKVEEIIKKNHFYEVPEIIVTDINGGSSDYLQWIKEETK